MKKIYLCFPSTPAYFRPLHGIDFETRQMKPRGWLLVLWLWWTMRRKCEREGLGVRTVNEALERLDIRCASHFIKRYKALRDQTPGEFCREEKKRLAKWRRERG